MRYKEERELLRAVKLGNGRKIDGHIIHVKKARFGWGERRNTVAVNGHNLSSKRPMNDSSSLRATRDTRSYKDVVTGLSSGQPPKSSDTPSICFDIEVEQDDFDWLKRSAVGVLHNYIHHASVQGSFFREGFYCQVRPLGGNTVLLTFCEKDEMEICIKDFKHWWNYWFEKVSPWSAHDVARDRFTWLRLEGVPLHLWSEKLFSAIGALWGSFVTTDDSTHRRLRFDIARILVSVKSDSAIPPSIFFKANGEYYKISITEEPVYSFPCMPSDLKPQKGNASSVSASGSTTPVHSKLQEPIMSPAIDVSPTPNNNSINAPDVDFAHTPERSNSRTAKNAHVSPTSAQSHHSLGVEHPLALAVVDPRDGPPNSNTMEPSSPLALSSNFSAQNTRSPSFNPCPIIPLAPRRKPKKKPIPFKFSKPRMKPKSTKLPKPKPCKSNRKRSTKAPIPISSVPPHNPSQSSPIMHSTPPKARIPSLVRQRRKLRKDRRELAEIMWGSRNLTLGDTDFSISDDNIQNMNNVFWREAKTTMEVCTLLGLEFDAEKDKVLNQIHHLEKEDDIRNGCKEGDPYLG